MGGDGGILTGGKKDLQLRRHRYDKGEAHSAEELAEAEQSRLWRYCSLSNNLLHPPIVADRYGTMFRKDELLEYLLEVKQNRAPQKPELAHIRKLKDVTQLDLGKRGERDDEPIGEADVDDLFECPVTHLLANRLKTDTRRFVFFRECGHICSERALEITNDFAEKGKDVSMANLHPNDVVCPIPGCARGRTFRYIANRAANAELDKVKEKPAEVGDKRLREAA